MATVKKNRPRKSAGTPVKKSYDIQSTEPAGEADSVSVRMYCHGFGDCFLLTFLSKGMPVYRMLIDCGMLTGNTERLKQVIEHVKMDCGGKLNLVVQTHQHKDHISGFNLRDRNKRLLWDSIEVDQVWQAWTENTGFEGDALATKLKERQESKTHALVKALGLYNKTLYSADYQNRLNAHAQGAAIYAAQVRQSTSIARLLEFNDINAEDIVAAGNSNYQYRLTMEDAMSYFSRRGRKNEPEIRYWNPGDLADVKTTGLKGVNFYFLGPPRDIGKLHMLEDNKHVEMYMSMDFNDNFFLALDDAASGNFKGASPFHHKYQIKAGSDNYVDHPWNLYHDEIHQWRSIETDWLHVAGGLALALDSYTNNTSLAFAIELEGSGKVLLFVGDAQIGNWISWTESKKGSNGEPGIKWHVSRKGVKETVTAQHLLERTVFYKVGHHASHNATARQHGLELMTSEDLVAMIPVDEEVAKRQGKNGWKMPAENLYKRLLEKTKSRIIRLDKGNILSHGVDTLPYAAKPTAQQLKDFKECFTESDIIITTDAGMKRPLFFEYLVRGRQ